MLPASSTGGIPVIVGTAVSVDAVEDGGAAPEVVGIAPFEPPLQATVTRARASPTAAARPPRGRERVGTATSLPGRGLFWGRDHDARPDGLVAARAGAAPGPLYRDLRGRPPGRAAAHVRRAPPGPPAGRCAEDRRDARGPAGLGVRGAAVHAVRDQRPRRPHTGDDQHRSGAFRPDAQG